MPRCSSYQRASACGSRARKKKPPMPVTRSMAMLRYGSSLLGMLRAAAVLFLARLDAQRQAVLRRRQRAGGEVIECARGVIGLVEIELRAARDRQRDVQ